MHTHLAGRDSTRQREAADRHAENMDRMFPVLVQLAVDGLPLPDSGALGRLAGMRPSTALLTIHQLAHAGRIRIERAEAKHKRVILICEGEHAGKRTATSEQAMRSLMAQARGAVDEPHQRRRGSAGQPCLWCEKPLPLKATAWASYCSNNCAKTHGRHGFGANRRLIEQRVAHIAQQPKGCATVDEFIAAGGSVYTEPLVRHA